MGVLPSQLGSALLRTGCTVSHHNASSCLQLAQTRHPPPEASTRHAAYGLHPRQLSPQVPSRSRSSSPVWRTVRWPLPARTRARKATHLAEQGTAQGTSCRFSDGSTGSGHSSSNSSSSESTLNSETERTRGLTVRAYAEDLPTQADAITGGVATADAPAPKMLPDLDYLQELIAIQQQGPRSIGFFGTRNMGFLHQQLIEILSYAMIITNNHIFTSGAAGTNAAVIRGALRAERPDLLTVILPQSLHKQPPESQELLQKVQNLVEMPHNDHLPLIEASRLCNMDILSHVQQVICFAFHDSRLLMETCTEAKNLRKIVTLFYLD